LALLEPLLQLLQRRRDHEDIEAEGVPAAQLARSLRVDVEENVLTSVEHGLERLDRRPVEVAVDPGPLRELAAVHHLLEDPFGHVASKPSAHATFWTCSRIRSTSVRAARTRVITSWSSAFEAMVLTSR